MSKNAGSLDRVIRVIIGIALAYFGFFQMAGIWGALVGIVGAVALVTGVIGWCPAYLPFGINTGKSA